MLLQNTLKRSERVNQNQNKLLKKKDRLYVTSSGS